MTVVTIFVIQVIIYASFPFYFARQKNPLRSVSFYIYLSILLTLGGFLGSVYSFPITETIKISGGNLLYGAFMMTTILFVIIEKDVGVMRRVIRLVITVNVLTILLFTSISQALESTEILSPFNTSASVFSVSVAFVILGGALIILELILMILVFEKIKTRITNVFAVSIFYIITFILILCLDGILFPAIAFTFNPNLVSIVIGGVLGKLVMAVAYSIPMLLFLIISRKSLTEYIHQPLVLREVLAAPRGKLVEEIQRQQKSLAQSKERLVEAQRMAKMGDFTWDVETGEVTWSEALFDLLGYDPSEKIDYAQVNRDIHHPDDLERVTQWLNECVASGSAELFTNEYRIIRKDGQVIHVRTQVEIRREAGQSAKIFGTVQEITEQKLAENALRESEEKFRGIYEQTPIAIQLYDKAGKLIDVNSQTLQIYGLKDKKPILGYEMWSSPLYTPELIERVKQGQPVIIDGDLDFEMVKKTNLFPTDKTGTIYLEMHISSLIRDKEITGYLVQMLDVTERKLTEQALADHRNHLEKLVEERTEKIQEKMQEHQKLFDMMVGREIRIGELKRVIKELRTQIEDAGLNPIANDPLLSDSLDEQ